MHYLYFTLLGNKAKSPNQAYQRRFHKEEYISKVHNLSTVIIIILKLGGAFSNDFFFTFICQYIVACIRDWGKCSEIFKNVPIFAEFFLELELEPFKKKGF